jgi:hypothetical protein
MLFVMGGRSRAEHFCRRLHDSARQVMPLLQCLGVSLRGRRWAAQPAALQNGRMSLGIVAAAFALTLAASLVLVVTTPVALTVLVLMLVVISALGFVHTILPSVGSWVFPKMRPVSLVTGSCTSVFSSGRGIWTREEVDT